MPTLIYSFTFPSTAFLFLFTVIPMSSEAPDVTVEDSAKKSDSQYYFFKSTPKELAEQYKPKQMSAEEAVVANQPATTGGPSSWNKGGTWEEQSANDFALARMNTLFIGLGVDPSVGFTASITECDSVNGEASIVFSRGKKRCSYEMQVELKWNGDIDGTLVSGVVELPDLDFTNVDDFDIEVKADVKDDAHFKARDALRKALPKQMYAQMAVFVKELLEHN